jgi:integrase
VPERSSALPGSANERLLSCAASDCIVACCFDCALHTSEKQSAFEEPGLPKEPLSTDANASYRRALLCSDPSAAMKRNGKPAAPGKERKKQPRTKQTSTPTAGRRSKTRKQAPALSSGLWLRWLQFLRDAAGARIYFAAWLTGEFGLRIGEALALCRSDLKTEADPPFVDVKGVILGARKSPGKVFIRPGSMKQLRKWLESGIPDRCAMAKFKGPKLKKDLKVKAKGPIKAKAKGPNAKAKGPAAATTGEGTWRIPREGFIFKARKGSARKHLCYNAVYNQFVKLAPAFLAYLEKDGSTCDSDASRLRPHSGRATFITQLMSQGLTTPITLKAARHKPASIKTHLAYGQLTLDDVAQALEKLESPGVRSTVCVRIRGGRLREASRADLLEARKLIEAEIRRRGS